jgi:hypothetical protein
LWVTAEVSWLSRFIVSGSQLREACGSLIRREHPIFGLRSTWAEWPMVWVGRWVVVGLQALYIMLSFSRRNSFRVLMYNRSLVLLVSLVIIGGPIYLESDQFLSTTILFSVNEI